jgi:hypothetical protein
MVEGVLAPLIDAIVAVAAAVIQFCFWILKASVRAWRYMFSVSYRTQVQEQLRNYGILQRRWFVFTNACAVLGSIVVVSLLIWIVVIA